MQCRWPLKAISIIAVGGGLSEKAKKKEKKRKTARGQPLVYFDVEPEERRTRIKVSRIFQETDGQTETAGVGSGGAGWGERETHVI